MWYCICSYTWLLRPFRCYSCCWYLILYSPRLQKLLPCLQHKIWTIVVKNCGLKISRPQNKENFKFIPFLVKCTPFLHAFLRTSDYMQIKFECVCLTRWKVINKIMIYLERKKGYAFNQKRCEFKILPKHMVWYFLF